MKRVVFSVLSILFAGTTVLAQPRLGSVELSLSPSFSSFKEDDSPESLEFTNIPIRLGYFLTQNFEIEPEFTLTIPDDSDATGILFTGNLVYHFVSKGRTAPFILGGIGVGNGYRVLGWATDQDATVFNFDLGVGFKSWLNRYVALRGEYRLRRYSGSRDEEFARDIKMTSHQLLVGLSVFLGGKE